MVAPSRMDEPVNLPPVEPPSAAFIVQLFVVPAVIVGLIVLVWLGFNWLASAPTDPRTLVQAMRRDTPHRWQSAVALADLLRNPQNTAARRDESLARELSDLLTSELQRTNPSASDVQLRYYLCQALGKFETPKGLPALLVAAQSCDSGEKDKLVVCDGALEAMAALAANLQSRGGLTDPAAFELLREKSNAPRPETRYRAAFALGQIGTPAALDRVETMLADGDAHVRYNAATALATHGRASALDVLVEMIDPAQLDVALEPQPERLRDAQRSLIVQNALRAVAALDQKDPQADLAPIVAALEKLLASDPPAGLRADAQALLNRIQAGAPAARAAG